MAALPPEFDGSLVSFAGGVIGSSEGLVTSGISSDVSSSGKGVSSVGLLPSSGTGGSTGGFSSSLVFCSGIDGSCSMLPSSVGISSDSTDAISSILFSTCEASVVCPCIEIGFVSLAAILIVLAPNKHNMDIPTAIKFFLFISNNLFSIKLTSSLSYKFNIHTLINACD